MKLFDIICEENDKKEKKLPYPPNSLNPMLFYWPVEGGDPRLQQAVEAQIYTDIEEINAADVTLARVVDDYVVAGPCLEMNAPKEVPVYVFLLINKRYAAEEEDNVIKERILQFAKDASNKMIPGTYNKIFYFVRTRPIEPDEFKAIYHPFTQKWSKRPSFFKESEDPIVKKTKELGKVAPKYKKTQSLKVKLGNQKTFSKK